MSFLTNNKYVKKYFISLKCHTENKSQESKSLLFSQWKKPPKRQQIVLIRNNAFLWYRWKWVIFYAFSKEAAFFFFSTKTKNGEMYLLWHVLTCDSEGLSVWLTKWPQTLESSGEKDGLLYDASQRFLLYLIRWNQGPYLSSSTKAHQSLCSLKRRSKCSQGSVSYWKHWKRTAKRSSGCGGDIHLCRARRLQRFWFWWIYDLFGLQLQVRQCLPKSIRLESKWQPKNKDKYYEIWDQMVIQYDSNMKVRVELCIAQRQMG